MDSAFARSGGIAAGRKRVITLVNLSDVFEKEERDRTSPAMALYR